MTKRLIARLDVKGSRLIKGVCFEGLRVLGSAETFASRYYEDGIDEIMFIDAVASLYGRNSLVDVLSQVARNVFVPIVAGGGVRSVNDAHQLLESGADKVAVNTAAIECPALISDIAGTFGSQCVVLSVQAKRTATGWECYTDGGRERSKLDAVEWIERSVNLGAGEVLVTSVDRDGTHKGLDTELIGVVSAIVPVPLIVGGGVGNDKDVVEGFDAGADAVAIGSALHYDALHVGEVRRTCQSRGITVREFNEVE